MNSIDSSKYYKVAILCIITFLVSFKLTYAQLPIEIGDNWRYFKGVEAPPLNWKDSTFNDISWLQGPSGFGYGNGDDNTVLSDMSGNYSSVYIRKNFVLNNLSEIGGILLEMDYDDGFVAYVNGVEVTRDNVNGNPPAHNALAIGVHKASSSGGSISYYYIDTTYLVSGNNSIAIQGHNVFLGSGGFSLIPVIREYFDVNTSSIGNGTITISPFKDHYIHNDIVEISAIANSGWYLSQWTGDLSGSMNPDTVVISSNLAIEANFSLITAIPDPPLDFQVISTGSYNIELSWYDNSLDEEWFIIERSYNESGPFLFHDSLPVNSTHYLDKYVEKGTTYFYQISSNNILGSSSFVGPVSATTDTIPSFTIIGLPDTQFYTDGTGSPDIFNTQTQWIVDNIPIYNIAFVSHYGDCVQNGDNEGDDSEWQIVDAAMSTIEDSITTAMLYGIPYGIAVGNHDQSPWSDADGTTIFYNQYFGYDRFQGRDYYGGHYGSNNDNHFQLFTVENLDFIIIHLEFDLTPDTDILSWADSLLQEFSDRRAILVGHHIIGGGNPGNFGYQGQTIYDSLKHNSNLFLMLCGHIQAEGRRFDIYNGDTIHTLLSNYQGRPNGGNGWLRIMEFFPLSNEIKIKTYSPYLDAWETDSNSEFELYYDMQERSVDISVQNTNCGNFEVKLKPNTIYNNNYLTNVQFTIKWPENTVNLTNFISTYGIAMQGSVVVENNTNYAVFASTANIPIIWTTGSEYTILSFSHDYSSTGYVNLEIDEGNWAIANNGVYYVELLGLDNTGAVYGNALSVYLGRCGDLKVFLQGAYDTIANEMNTGLSGNIPLSQPYNTSPWNYTGTESVITIPNPDVVDWLLLEFRDATDAGSANGASTIERQAAFLLRDGSIVGLDGTSLIQFNGVITKQLFVVVRHRNHLDIISANPLTDIGGIFSYNFTTSIDQVYGSDAGYKSIESGIYGMVGGDADANGSVYIPDKTSWSIYGGAKGYLSEDLDMDGQVNNPDKNDIWISNYNTKSSQVPE